MSIIRPEQPGDEPEIAAILIAAFPTVAESQVVAGLRGTPDWVPELSLVVQHDKALVAHALLSRVTAGNSNALMLGPIAVLPDWTGGGLASSLVGIGLAKAKELEFDCVIAIGDPGFYPQFGFIPARNTGLTTEMPIPDEAFLVTELLPGGINGGPVLWPDAWDLD